MPEVLIVGTSTPCVDVARGEQVRVKYTDRVQRLIDRGYVEVVEWYDDPAPKRGRPKRKPVNRGSSSPDRGEPNPQRVAAEGPAQDRAVDAEGETSS